MGLVVQNGVDNGVTGGTPLAPPLYMYMKCEYFSTTDMIDK